MSYSSSPAGRCGIVDSWCDSKANNDDHRGCSYIILVTKIDRVSTQNSKHICSTYTMSEKYLCEQIKNLSGRLKDILAKNIQWKCTTPHKQHSVNTTRETLMGQISPSQSVEGKVKESQVAHDIADKYKIGGKNQIQQAAQEQKD